ncbi:Ribophorin I [Dipodascopsis uninucleata]
MRTGSKILVLAWLLLFMLVQTCVAAPESIPDMASSFVPEKTFKITNVVRTLDLSKSYVREAVSYTFTNEAKISKEYFYLAYTPSEYESMSFIDIKQKLDKVLQLIFVESTSYNEKLKLYFLKVKLATSVDAGDKAAIQVMAAYTNLLEVQPKKIKQSESQALIWTGSRFLTSAYAVERQRLKFKFGSGAALNYPKTKEEPIVEGNTLTYGPYYDIEPLIAEDISVKFDYSHPIVRVKELSRELWVSNWGGNLATEEKYNVQNAAAKLSEPFSRLRFHAGSMANERSVAIRGFTVALKPGVRDTYFTDEIGNVSTSSFRVHERTPVLELRPRYPIFGGWNYTFTLGYNHDLQKNLRVVTTDVDEDTYILKVPYLEGPDNVIYDKVDFKVVLPQGASDIEVSTTLTNYNESISLLKSHLDTVGRTVLTLSKSNLVDEHKRHDVYVKYTYTAADNYTKPLVVSTALATLFFAYMIISRL